jgi:hypothetical protein
MTFQFSVAVRNARLDAVETQIGASAVLKVFSGAEPVDCAAADPAGLLATLTLDADWMNAAAGGSKTKLGTWSNAASGTGTAASWRLYANDGTTCGAQGNITITGGGGDMTVDNIAFVASQTFTVTTFTLSDGNS